LPVASIGYERAALRCLTSSRTLWACSGGDSLVSMRQPIVLQASMPKR
jgi:hypothetical protein